METSIFPSVWKKSDVTPVRKPGKAKSRAESFRPVALLSHLGKVLEMIVREDLQKYLEDNNKLVIQKWEIMYITVASTCRDDDMSTGDQGNSGLHIP